MLNEPAQLADWYLYSTMLGHFYYPIHYDHVFENPKTRVTTAGFHGVSGSLSRMDQSEI